MGDPAREHMHRKRKEKRERVAETHEPIVLWVNTDKPKKLKSFIMDTIKKLPSVTSVASRTHEPSDARVANQLGVTPEQLEKLDELDTDN